MKHTLALIAVATLSLSLSGEAFAKAAQCRDAKGKFMKCPPAAASTTTTTAHTYKLDAKGNCHDEKGKMAKKAMCKAA